MSILLSDGRDSNLAMMNGLGSTFANYDMNGVEPAAKPTVNGSESFYETVMSSHRSLGKSNRFSTLLLDGQSLELTDLVRGARYDARIQLSKRFDILEKIHKSVELLHDKFDNGQHVYGVTTGFGGSADVRTSDMHALQQGLLQHHIVGVLMPSDVGKPSREESLRGFKSHALPRDVVRASMIVRCNSLLRGHSSVRFEVIQSLTTFINEDMIPIIPLRGSISASGDLTPLSYIAGSLEGHPSIYVQAGQRHSFKIMRADEALAAMGIKPIIFRAKEGLGIMNGTAVSVAAGALAHHEAERLAILVQFLTAMATEGLHGTRDSFHPFIGRVRPHEGQTESAKIIYDALASSKLERDYGEKRGNGLAQDRYALRTASQWIGPQLEDLALSRVQLATELNSTTDNPLIDIEADKIHHGGNFQAASVTSAMEKTRLAVQMLGKLLFAQTSEMISADHNGKLPPNLAFDDPSVSFALKGLDINMAAYMSELAYLANPVSSHVQSAEMNNQAVNSLALISARYTQDATEILSLMASVHLYTVCQALDLQVFQIRFAAEMKRVIAEHCSTHFPHMATEASLKLTENFMNKWDQLKTHDLVDRCAQSVKYAISTILSSWVLDGYDIAIVPMLKAWGETVQPALLDAYTRIRQQLLNSNGSITSEYLGRGTRSLYRFIRMDLNVPALRGLVDHPRLTGVSEAADKEQYRDSAIGNQVIKFYEVVERVHSMGLL